MCINMTIYLKLNCDSVRAFIVCLLRRTSIQVIPNTIANRITNETTHNITVNEIVPAKIHHYCFYLDLITLQKSCSLKMGKE